MMHISKFSLTIIYQMVVVSLIIIKKDYSYILFNLRSGGPSKQEKRNNKQC
jgi:hypothetical protein